MADLINPTTGRRSHPEKLPLWAALRPLTGNPATYPWAARPKDALTEVAVWAVERSGSPLGMAEAGGMWLRTRRSISRCRVHTSIRSESRALLRANLNSPNRRMQTRMSGGVGGK